MNAFDYFFENSRNLNKDFLVGKETISFRALYDVSLGLAYWLRGKIGSNQHVMVISENNIFFISAYLAILKSGNICVPLDPGIEEQNLQFIAGLTRPGAAFLSNAAKKLQINSPLLITPEMLKVPLAAESGTTLATESDACAEVIFTSGSTGKPKGVMISHENLIANTASIVEYLALSHTDRMLVVLPFYYCYGLSLLHTHLRAGGSLVLNNSFMFLGTIISNLVEYKCTGFAGVPSHFQFLLRVTDTFKNTSFPDLKYVTQAGGKLATVFIDEFRNFFPGIKFIVMYGQTEATARLSYLPPEEYERKKGSIGKGIPGVKLRMVNDNGEDIEPGETGELIARGNNIMLGYLGDTEGTQTALRNDWLYTGDIGTIDEDGYIFLTARIKEIIKVGGKRISPKEIETVILEVPDVIDCTVDGKYDELLGEAIRASIVVSPGKSKDAVLEEIKKQCSRKLAHHKIPQHFEISDKIIISATGKKIKRE